MGFAVAAEDAVRAANVVCVGFPMMNRSNTDRPTGSPTDKALKCKGDGNLMLVTYSLAAVKVSALPRSPLTQSQTR